MMVSVCMVQLVFESTYWDDRHWVLLVFCVDFDGIREVLAGLNRKFH